MTGIQQMQHHDDGATDIKQKINYLIVAAAG